MTLGSGKRWTDLAAAVATATAFVAVIVVNALANILPLNGVGTGTLSDEIPNLFVPAGLTFSVWGLIYLLLTVYVVAVFVRVADQDETAAVLWRPLDGLIFVINGLANVAWIFAWHWRLVPLSLAIMLVILTTLIALEERNFARLTAKPTAKPSFLDFALKTPVNVYLGWICVATIANVTAVLVTAGWNGFGLDPLFWTVVVIAAGLTVAIVLAVRRRAVAAPLVVVWAYAGIIIKRTSTDPDYSRPVWIAAAIAAAVILLLLIVRAAKAVRVKTA